MKKRNNLDKHKISFLVYILIFCVCLTGIGGFYLGKSMGDSYILVNTNTKIEPLKIPAIDPNLSLVQDEFNKVVEVLNSRDGLFNTEFVTTYLGNDFLGHIAPLLMEKLYGGKYKTVNQNVVISSMEYEKFRKYFNVYLDSIGDSYLAYQLGDYRKINIHYELGTISKNSNYYVANINCFVDGVLYNKGSIRASIVDNHIFYLSIKMA